MNPSQSQSQSQQSPPDQSVTYRIRHTTTYGYEELVAIAHNEARLIPRDSTLQTAHSTRFVVEPAPSFMQRDVDYFGNWVNSFALEEPHRQFVLTAHSEVTVHRAELPVPGETPAWERVPFALRQRDDPENFAALEYAFGSPQAPVHAELEAYARPSFPQGRPVLEGALDLMHRIHNEFTFDPKATSVTTPVLKVFEKRRGVCQDFAHLQVACLRALGLSARYVSGYLQTRPPPGKERLIGADASHAWLAVYCPGHGFVDLDPTNDCFLGLDHVTLGWGRDFGDVSPLKGVVLGGGKHSVAVAVDVMRRDG